MSAERGSERGEELQQISDIQPIIKQSKQMAAAAAVARPMWFSTIQHNFLKGFQLVSLQEICSGVSGKLSMEPQSQSTVITHDNATYIFDRSSRKQNVKNVYIERTAKASSACKSLQVIYS